MNLVVPWAALALSIVVSIEPQLLQVTLMKYMFDNNNSCLHRQLWTPAAHNEFLNNLGCWQNKEAVFAGHPAVVKLAPSGRCEQMGSDQREPMQVPVMSSAMQARWMSSVRDIGHTARIIHMLWHITVLLGNAQGLMKTCSATRNSAKCQGHASLPGRT